jgi:hypothetical protein
MSKTNTKTTETPTTETKVESNVPAQFANKTPEQLRAEFGSWSGAMRAMSAAGMKYGPIAKVLGKKFQHVRNVIITPVGKSNTAA